MREKIKALPDPVVVFFVILTGWTGAWLLYLALSSRYVALGDGWAETLYWLIARVLTWVPPALWLLRKSGMKASAVFRVSSWKKTVTWGLGIGGGIFVLHLAVRLLSSDALLRARPVYLFMDAVLIAPVFEEFLFRGVLLPTLKQNASFAQANLLTAFLFVLLHCPGWYFQGVMQAGAANFIYLAVTIFIIGLVLGLAAEKGKSVYTSWAVHVINNLT